VCQLRQSIASLTLTPTRLPTFFFDAPKSRDFVGHSFPIVATHNGLVDRSVTRPPHRIFQRPLAMAIDYALSLSLDAIRIAKAKSHLTTLPETKNFFCPKFRPRSRERLCGKTVDNFKIPRRKLKTRLISETAFGEGRR
jgi:hypothetical protein